MATTIQGNDVEMVSFQVKDSGGVLIPVANWLDYEMMIYYKTNNKKTYYFSFKKTPGTTDKAFVAVNTTTVGFIIDRVKTKALPVGAEVYAESRIQLTAGTEYLSNKKNVGDDGQLITTIKEGARPSALA